jgi:2-keto-4-pentenoate hydratase
MTTESALVLVEARREHRRLPGLPSRPADLAQAYRVQEEAQRLLFEADDSILAGYKIGCTTAVMQAFLNIPSPCSGMMASHNILTSPVRLSHKEFLHVGVECEIAVRLGKPLLPENAPFTRDTVAPAVGACMAAIEVVDDRWTDYGGIDTASLIADNFFRAACVLGPAVEDWQFLDLAAVRGTTMIDGVEVGIGVGADVMGHPFKALAWLANALAARGKSLNAGEIVLTGSVVATHWVEPGAKVEVELSGLGRVEVTFTV